MGLSDPANVGTEIMFERVGDHVAVVTLNRPEKRNAVNVAMTRELADAVRRVEEDDSIRVAILASSLPTVFCAGADISEVAAGRAFALSTPDGGFAGFHAAKRKKPWIAAVRGAALGGGFELCLACEMIVAAQDAQFGLPEVKRGLFAAAAGAYRLARTLPRNLAIEMLATGDSIDAVRAHALGLVNRVVPADRVLAEALTLAGRVASCAPLGVQESIHLAKIAIEHDENELRTLTQEAAARVFGSADAKEGTRAFAEKREPVWSGR